MGTGASSVKPEKFSREDNIDEKDSSGKPCGDKDPQSTTIFDGADREGSGRAKFARKSSFSATTSNSTTSLKGQSKTPTSVLPPIKKQSSSSNLDKVHSLSSSSLKDGSPNAGSVFEKVKHLENELANSESERLDAEDKIRVLESRIKDLTSGSFPAKKGDDQLSETVHAKDQYIVKLEKDLKSQQAEANSVRLKLKKRIKGLTNQLHETRQEASITQMELRQELIQNKEKLKELSSSQPKSLSPGNAEDSSGSNSKVIVELSNQLSEQEEQIASLETQVVEKDLLIASLQRELKNVKPENTNQPVPDSEPSEEPVQPSGDRLQSGRGSRYKSSLSNREASAESHKTNSTTWKSSALSDSDSDWDMSEGASQTHSAPARVRVKSAQSVQSGSKQVSLGGSLHSDDDSIMQYLNNHEHSEGLNHTSDHHRVKPHKKSALKSHLEKRKVENQTGGLMGPSLAFHTKDSPPDTSCEPTPRHADSAKLPGFPKLTVINAGYH